MKVQVVSSDSSFQHHSLLFHALPTILDTVETMHIGSSDEPEIRPSVVRSKHVSYTSATFEEVDRIALLCVRWYEQEISSLCGCETSTD